MLKLYELLVKVGTNPQLRAWAMKQIIKLRHLKPRYKGSFSHKMDKDKVKDIIDPGWSTKQFLKDQNFNLKTKVVPIDQAKKTINIRKIGRQSDKDKFYGVTGQATTAVNRVRKDIDDFWKKHALEDKWFDKTMKKHLKGDKKATKALDQDRAIYEYEQWIKAQIEKDKVVTFWPRKKPFKKPPGKAEGGIASLENGGSSIPDDMDYPEWFNLLQGPQTEEWPVDSDRLVSVPEGEPFMMEEFLEAVKKGFRGTYDEYIDQIDRSPADYMGAAGGRVGMLGGGLLRTGIMEVLYPLLKGPWKGTLGQYKKLLEQFGKIDVKSNIDKAMQGVKSSRAVNLAKDVRQGLLDKIKGYKEGFQGATISRRAGDHVDDLKYLIKETKKDLKHIDDFLLKKEAGVATKHAEGGRIGFKKGTKKRKRTWKFAHGNVSAV